MSEHDLKTWPRPFQAVLDGGKAFEFRKDDRGFAVGDTLWLREYDPAIEQYTGRETRIIVTYILHGGIHGLPKGYVVMSTKPLAVRDDTCPHCEGQGGRACGSDGEHPTEGVHCFQMGKESAKP
jgi:hypothetical protein